MHVRKEGYVIMVHAHLGVRLKILLMNLERKPPSAVVLEAGGWSLVWWLWWGLVG
jgi:hypothetical protein